ncbi:MAG: helix-turn-helix transcriptional regulator [Humibacillus sp.]
MSNAAGHGLDAFGDALRHVRRVRGLSQRGLADLAGVPQSRIARLEAGHLCGSLESVTGLYRFLGFSVGLHHLHPCPDTTSHGNGARPCTEWADDGSVA